METNDFALVRQPPSAIAKAERSTKRVLSGMVGDVLALIHAETVGAIFKRGMNYYFGEGVQQDYATAARLFREAAEKGHAGAQRNLGCCCRDGIGVPKNHSEAVMYFRKAAEQGDAWGQYSLAYCYYRGLGVAQDYAEAMTWFRKSAEQGNIWAQSALASCYSDGTGVTQNHDEAYKWRLHIVADLEHKGFVGAVCGPSMLSPEQFREFDRWCSGFKASS